MRTSYVQRAALVCFVLIMALTGSAKAQDYWMYPGGINSISLQAFKPSLAGHSDRYGFLTSTWVVSARIRASDNVAVFVSLPMSNVVVKYHDQSYGLSLLGNPYFGLEIGQNDTSKAARPVGRIGFRLPIASDEKYRATEIGAQTLFNSLEGFAPDLLTLQLGMGSDYVSRGGVTTSFNLDVATLIPSEGGGDSEVFGNYNLSVILRNSGFSGSFGFAGRIWITEGDMDFGERTAHQLGFTVGYQMGAFRPGAHFRVPLDEDLSDFIDNVYGISLTFAVK